MKVASATLAVSKVSCRLHDLRHTFVTHLAESGVSESIMLAPIGPRHISMTAKRDAMAGVRLRPIITNSEGVPVNPSQGDRQFSDPQVIDSGGERGRNRTYNLVIKSHLLCQLSYAPDSGIISKGAGVRNVHLRQLFDCITRFLWKRTMLPRFVRYPEASAASGKLPPTRRGTWCCRMGRPRPPRWRQSQPIPRRAPR